MAPQFDRPLRDLLRAAGCTLIRQGKGSNEIWFSPVTKRNFPVPIGIPSRHMAGELVVGTRVVATANGVWKTLRKRA